MRRSDVPVETRGRRCMAMKWVKVRQAECQQCGHKWRPRVKDVRMCPRCKSIRWDKPGRGRKSP